MGGGYQDAQAVWNANDRGLDAAVIVRPHSAQGLAGRDALDERLTSAVRSGGHSLCGLSNVEGGLVIALSSMKGISVNTETRLLRPEPCPTVPGARYPGRFTCLAWASPPGV
ncbi:FAD-binding protein [Deinococcus ruber]|uniref:FAD linked oxidase N-terminal domain-containing protein n=1 Tax=Deinococcus ruber TaxID=1848197 RepID=A0A918F9Y2_9DEIO|nr:FAD-binding protein [Deinococcus ruber]GGR19476.1 hypothetical protein GCM10008957_34980 [Deinococcus ruber]